MSRRRSRAALLSLGAPGVVLQLAGLVYACWPGRHELDLFGALLVMAVGTLLLVLAAERHAAALERSDRWALCGLLGPLSLYLAASLRPAWAVPHHPARPRTLADRAVASLLTVAILAGFAWAGTRWFALGGDVPAGAAQMRSNEQLAFQRLGIIIDAQRRYRQRDWDGDGRKTYARFHVHLWRNVDRKGRPVAVDLIPRELGFAMAPGLALDGYYFKNIHSKAIVAGIQGKPTSAGAGDLDLAREWAVAAIPHKPRLSGTLSFVAHSSGAIWTPKPGSGTSSPPRWIRIKSASHLKELQASSTKR